jgi:hypothetical protein
VTLAGDWAEALIATAVQAAKRAELRMVLRIDVCIQFSVAVAVTRSDGAP